MNGIVNFRRRPMNRLPRLVIIILILAVVAVVTPATAPVNAQQTSGICDRTPEVQDAILARLVGTGATCSTVTQTQLASVPYVSIVGYSSARIIPDDFANLPNLFEISISHSTELTTVPADAFIEVVGYSKLEYVSLYKNDKLTDVQKGAFDGLFDALVDGPQDYVFLGLSDNSIETLEPGVFDGLSNLEQLSLNNNPIQNIEPGLFDGLTKLNSLSLGNIGLKRLDKATFGDLPELRTLWLSTNEISELDAGTFSGMPNLEELDMRYNNISVLPADIFDGLTYLDELILSANSLTELDADIFDGLTSLQRLSLNVNNLSALPAGIFNGLDEVYFLTLSDNDLSSFPAGTFAGLTSLQSLSLSANQISSLDASTFAGLTNLGSLYLYANQISSLDASTFAGLTNLGSLYLYANQISSLDADIFDGLGALGTLYLDDNRLSSLDADIFDGLTSLQWLDLSNNDLSSLDADTFDGLTGLVGLYIENNESLSSLPSNIFEDLDEGLLYLSLRNNNLSSLDANIFDGLTGLYRLYLTGNNLSSLDADIFDGLANLQRLYLDDNILSSLPSNIFEDLDDSLWHLVLTGNTITTLPANIFDGLTGLRSLDLSCNSLSSLPLARFDPLTSSLTYLDVSGNSYGSTPSETDLRNKFDQITTTSGSLWIGPNTECLPPYTWGLSGISLSTGKLSSPFEEPGRATYRARVDHDVSSITVTVTPKDPRVEIEPRPGSSFEYDNDPNTPGIQVDLVGARTNIGWQVPVRNGAFTLVYQIGVYRDPPPATNALLRSLELSNITLESTFDGRIDTYSATTATSETIVTATPIDPWATTVIKLNGRVDADGNVDLEMGSNNVITVEVTAEDGTTTEIYTVTVTRTPPEVTLPAPRLPAVDDPHAIWLATLTVADLGSNEYGYNFAQCGRGGLTDTAFTYLGDDTPLLENQSYTGTGPLYTIEELSYVPDSNSLLFFLDRRFTQDTADNIFLDVDGTRLKFSDASYYSPSHSYQWTVSNLSWSVGDEVPVKIVVLKDADGPNGLAATTALVPKTGPTGAKYETRNLTLTWSAPTSGGAVTGYRVEYQPDPALQWRTLVASQTGTTYTQTGKLRRVVDYYRVAALRSGGVASYSDMVRVQVAPETSKIPEKVGYLEAGPAPCSKLKLAWNRAYTPISKSGDGVGSGVRAMGYQVQYALDDGGYPKYRVEGEDWLTVTLPRWLNGLSWRTWPGSIEEIEFKERRDFSPDLKTVVTGLAPDTNYRVRVRGCNDAGCGEWTIPKLAETSGAVSNATEADPLTATLQDIPANHDGSSAFTFRIAFSADVTISPRNMRDHALIVSGGTVTGARRVDSRKDLWELTVAPAGTGAVSILAPQDRACTETGALCTADGRMLSTGLGRSVPGPALQGQRSPAPLANSTATGALSISGTAQVGETLTADTSGIADAYGLDNATYTYQWVANDGTTDTDISGETDATYTLVSDDEGKTIEVRVSFIDDAGNEATLTSAATAVVAAPEPPAKPTGLSATPSHDRVVLNWDDPQDDAITGYVILRRDREIHLVGTFVTITGDTGSADTTYTDATVEPDKQYVYRIKAINEHGEVSEESDWVRGFTPAVPVPDKPTGLSVVVSHDTVTLTWDNPQDDAITGYVILRRDREIHLVGTFVTITGDTGSADTTYTDDTVEPDKQYVYRIKAINEYGKVSEESDWVRGFTPAAPAPAGSPAK